MNKKPYVRPVLVHESFELAQSVAAGCSLLIGASKNCDSDTIGVTGELNLLPHTFLEGGICAIYPHEQEQYCYTPGAGAIFVLAAS